MRIFSSKNEKEDKVKAGFFTGILSLLLILLLIFAGFTSIKDDESDGGGGVEVQMGEPDKGGPDDTPANERLVPVSPQQDEPEESVVTNQDDGVPLDNQNRKENNAKKNNEKEPEKNKEPERTISDDLENMINSSKNSKGNGEGNNSGTQGDPSGKGSSTSGGNGGSGDGPGAGKNNGFQLGDGFGNRKISNAPTIRSACTNAKGGRVIFKVEVAPNGTIVNVLNPNTGERGTNITDACLMREAVGLVKKVKLTPSNDNMNTIGEITITIKN